MELRKFGIERYKGYTRRAEVQLAPLTILVGPNNSGKTALAQAIQLLVGGMTLSGPDASEPLPLDSGGIRHGETFEDLVTGRTVHGQLRMSATLVDDTGETSLSATIRNVVTPNRPSARQIAEWRLASGGNEIVAERQGFDDRSDYLVSLPGTPPQHRWIDWQGLIPLQPGHLADWAERRTHALRNWALGVRHLQCPRSLRASPFATPEHSPAVLGPDGRQAPLALAADHELRESVRKWYGNAFGETIDVAAQGSYSELIVGSPARGANVRLVQSGRGLSQILPVVVMALTAAAAGPGVDVIEHPEAELHPAAHADVAELLLANLPGPIRPMVVETHSEMMLLRARRWIAEGRLPAEDVLVYWIHTEPGSGSIPQKIEINDRGEMDSWPDGVFIEDYEEIMAIRRTARTKG